MNRPALLLTLEYPPQIGGVANYYAELMRHMPLQSVLVVHNHYQRLSPWLKAWLVLWDYYRRYHFSSIIVGQILPLGTVVWLWQRLFRTPYIVCTHGMDITVPQRYWRKRILLRLILRSARFVVTVSRYSQAQLQQVLPQSHWKKIVIIAPGPIITPQTPAEAWPQPLPQRFMLSVGRLVQRKGFDTALRALAALPAHVSDLHYVIAGAGPERDHLFNLAHQLQLQERVHFLGAVTNGQLTTLYQACEFLVMPSRNLADGDFEGFGIVALEANAFAKPVIGSRAGGIADAIISQQTGVLVEPDNVAQLAQVIGHLTTDRNFCQRLGQHAQAAMAQQSWSAKAEQLRALLKAL